MAVPQPPFSVRGEFVRTHRGRKRTLRLGRGRCWFLRLRRFIADHSYLAEQLRHLHAGERFEERRHLRGNFRDVTGQLVSAGCVAISRRDDGDLVHFAERLGERAHNFRQAADQFVHHGGLVVLLESFGLYVHGFGFRFAFLEDDFGFGFALGTDSRGAAFGFAHQPLALRVGKRFDALTLDLRSLQHGGDEFAFAARNFRLLHLHLGLAFHLLYADRFGDDLLLHHVGLDFVGFIGCGLGFLGHFQVAGFFYVEVAFCFRLLRKRSGFGCDAFLIGLCLRNGGRSRRFGAFDGDVAIGFGGGYFRVALDSRDVRPAHISDVLVLVAHFFQGEAHDFEPHLVHVIGAGGPHAIGNHFRFLDDLLYRELPDDSAQVAFHHQPD